MRQNTKSVPEWFSSALLSHPTISHQINIFIVSMFLRAKFLFFVFLRTVATSLIRRRWPFSAFRNKQFEWEKKRFLAMANSTSLFLLCLVFCDSFFRPVEYSVWVLPWYVANADATTIQVKMCSVVTVLFAILFLVLLLLLVFCNRFLVPSFYCTEEHSLYSSIMLVVAAESTSKYFRIK